LVSKKLLLGISFTAFVLSNLYGQDKVMDIWNGKVPNSISNPSIHQVIDSSGGWVKMINVSVPTLEVYLPQKSKSNGTAVIICPGGAYALLAIKHEGKDVAQWLNSLGITAFVLNYRLPNDATMKDKSIAPLQDAQQAMRIVRKQAEEWGINH